MEELDQNYGYSLYLRGFCTIEKCKKKLKIT